MWSRYDTTAEPLIICRSRKRITTTLGAVAAAVAGTGLVVAPMASAADRSVIHVTATSAPVWTSNKALPIAYTASYPGLRLGCSPMLITLSWRSAADTTRHRTVVATPTAGTQGGVVNIPARTVRPGTLRYRVSARQSCGELGTVANEAVGRSPVVGWSTARIR